MPGCTACTALPNSASRLPLPVPTMRLQFCIRAGIAGACCPRPRARGARLLLLGGEPLDGPRHLWWNFVSSRQDRIEQAKDDWKQGHFAPVPSETEIIPLPE